MLKGMLRSQSGMSLIEVLVTALVLTIGLVGAGAAQLKALQYADAARMDTQASFIAYDMLDRIRANVDGNPHSATQVLPRYALASLDQAPASANPANALVQDLFDFKTNIQAFAGADAEASIVLSGAAVTINLQWSDRRAAGEEGALRTFTLSSALDE
jgi:type IV pilus assembly protein PilV